MRPQCKAKVSSGITAVMNMMVSSIYPLLCGDFCVKTDVVNRQGPLARVSWVHGLVV